MEQKTDQNMHVIFVTYSVQWEELSISRNDMENITHQDQNVNSIQN